MDRLLALLRCGSGRFAAFYFLTFYVVWLDSHAHRWSMVAFSATLWLLHSYGTEFLNRLSDRVEDEVNRPERTALCRKAGYDTIRRAAIGAWAAGLAIAGLWVASERSAALAVLIGIAFVVATNYSYGLRFKRRRFLALFVLTMPNTGPLLVSLAWRPASYFLARPGPLLLVLGLFVLSLAGAKDVTDAAGDARIGYRSAWVALIRSRRTWIVAAWMSMPFAATAALVAARIQPLRNLALLAFLPVSLLFAAALRAAREDQELQAAREFVYHYWFLFLSAALWLYLPTPEVAWTIAGSWAFWLVMTQTLHWTDGIRARKVRILSALLRRAVRPPRTGPRPGS